MKNKLICFFSLFLLGGILFFYPSFAMKSRKQTNKPIRWIPIKGVDSIMKRDKISAADSQYLALLEDSALRALTILQTTDTALSGHEKSEANRLLLTVLNKALHIPYSFAYPFTQLYEHISIIYPDDSTFRMLTWQYSIDDMNAMKQGVLQLNTTDGKAKIFPLLDRTHQIHHPLDTITGSTRWIGAMYYQILTHNIGRRRIYTLLGIDEHTLLSTRKWIEILRFSKEGTPYFGGDFFSFVQAPTFLEKNNNLVPNSKDKQKKMRKRKDPDEDKVPLHFSTTPKEIDLPQVQPISYKRFMIEYDKQTIANLRYDESLGIIIFDHLAPATDATIERKYTYSIDGDYSGFIWQKGKWTYIPQVFSYSSQETGSPVSKPINFKKQGQFYERIRR